MKMLYEESVERNGGSKMKRCVKMKFGESDDAQLRELVKSFGCKDWELISMKMGNRNPRQCRERWEHYLSPKVNNGPWTPEEDKIMLARYEELGSRWNAIAKFLKGRTNTCVKNRYLFLQRAKERKLRKIARNSKSVEKTVNLTSFTDLHLSIASFTDLLFDDVLSIKNLDSMCNDIIFDPFMMFGQAQLFININTIGSKILE